ncbi:bifunctional diguanylate cyclase/phosphodiesterase [Qipengyuania sp. JC766]|uniref:putative bifunctional diguanylate cyclase/phosphodiesterase n=1 Tax=Qipengyuania sp. JC766 TaxID=3232139 RepID=UPI003459A0D7
MLGWIQSRELTPRMLVFVPLVVLSLLFILLLSLVFMAESMTMRGKVSALVGGLALYGATAALLCRMGLERIGALETLGLTDSLSDLPNRRALHADVRQDLEADRDIAVALIDLDGFKLVNDLYGHHVGDTLIRSTSEMLLEICAKDARCYRLGGDEFALMMSGPLSATMLEGICRKFLDRLALPIAIDDRRIAIGASIGLARGTVSDPLTSSELLRRADVAMYASKKDGKMRITIYKPGFDRSLEAIRELDHDLREALANEEFKVAYQPLVDAKTGAIVAVESLLRWERPDGRVIGPNVFIPVAEESGLINAIGVFVLRRACREALGWDDIKLSVNISAAQLRNPEFPILLGQILEETGFPPERLELEITETSLVLDPVVAERALDVIRGFGVSVALDDFGTGYASIGFLRQFRFEKLKLDRSLVMDSTADESSRAMMLSSISMAQALKMGVTAEGVETEAQADMVRTAGCDQIQGWLYFKAMAPDQVGELLCNAFDTGTIKHSMARG